MRRHIASGLLASAALAAGLVFTGAPAQAQVSGCEQMQKLLQQRQSLVQRLNVASGAKKRLTPQQACSTLGQLVNNGNETLKFATANKDWCQIPDSFVDGMKTDNERASTIRNQACNAAKQQAAMQKRAQQQAQGASNNPFARPDAITGGPMRVPQGAL